MASSIGVHNGLGQHIETLSGLQIILFQKVSDGCINDCILTSLGALRFQYSVVGKPVLFEAFRCRFHPRNLARHFQRKINARNSSRHRDMVHNIDHRLSFSVSCSPGLEIFRQHLHQSENILGLC